MKLLVVTQAADENDQALGFFTGWIGEFSKHAERVEVICLTEGKHALPANARVHSLGKEQGRQNRFVYAWRFLSLAWNLRHEYDAVFVHMNQEYVLLAGWLWKLLGKPLYMWRNHYAGSWLTDIAAAFSMKVFCTSKHSYTAKYAKTVLMPVGVDTDRFKPDDRISRKPHSILFLSRMSPAKRPDMLLDALAILARSGTSFTATFVGSPLPKDEAYYRSIKGQASTYQLDDVVAFLPGVPNAETPALYRSHEVFVNCSSSGMFDKTLFEAAACGCRVLAASADFAGLAGSESYFTTAEGLAMKLKAALAAGPGREVPVFVAANSLAALGEKLMEAMEG